MVPNENSKTRIHNMDGVTKGVENIGEIDDMGVVDSDLWVHCWRSPETKDHLFFLM